MSQHDSNYWTTYIILIVSKYLLDSAILFTQYIQIPIHPLNTIYQIIYLNIQPTHLYFFGYFYTCEPIIYTYKPLIYTRKKIVKKSCYLHSVQQSYESNTCKPELSTLQV